MAEPNKQENLGPNSMPCYDVEKHNLLFGANWGE